jgi:hypothetical protein
MRRSMLSLIASAATLLVPASGNASHCNQISVYSFVPVYTTGVAWDPASFVGCGTNPEQNTDLLIPGSTGTQAYFASSVAPIDGYFDEDGILRGSYIEIGGTVVLLSFTRGTNVGGNPADFWRSPILPHTQEQSVSRGFTVDARVCTSLACVSREYRTATT